MARKEKKYNYIYRTTNNLTGKYYIGMHSTDELDDGYLGSGKILTRSIKKYSKDRFNKEILEYCDTRKLLADKETEYITESVLNDKLCMNLQLGGEGWNTLGQVTVRDKHFNYLNVFKDDPRYLSGELVAITIGMVPVIDNAGRKFNVFKDDPRYLSGELVSIFKGTIIIKDKKGNIFRVDKNDPRYLSGELVGIAKDKITVKNKNEETFQVDKNDPRYLSGELVGIWKGKKHSEETKIKISETRKINNICKGEKNPMFGRIWIHSLDLQISKPVPKNELTEYLDTGWTIGRKKKLYK